MLEFDFVSWLIQNNTPKKLCSDYVSRIKRVEHAIKDCDIDEAYMKDKCEGLIELFKNSGQNEKMANLIIGDLPIGKYYLATYKYAIKKYIEFKTYYQKNITKSTNE